MVATNRPLLITIKATAIDGVNYLLIKAGYNSVKIREGFFEWGRRNEERMCGRGGLRCEEAKKRRHDLHNQRVVLLVVPLAYLMVVNYFVGTTQSWHTEKIFCKVFFPKIVLNVLKY